MKKIFLLTVISAAWLSGCAGKPTDALAREHLKKRLRAEMGDGVDIASFKAIKTSEGDLFGIKSFTIEYSYELLCRTPVPIKGLRRFPLENVILLDEFFKNQTKPWQDIDFTPVLRVRLADDTKRVVSEAYAQKRSLFFCKPGEKRDMKGKTRFLLRESGWTID